VASFEEALRELRERFVAGSGERLERIAQLLDLLDHDPSHAGSLRDLMLQFHGLAGSGSTYGFPRVSALGLEGERLCDACAKEKAVPADRERQRWRSLLASLRKEFTRGSQAAAPAAPSHATAAQPFDVLIVEPEEEARAVLSALAARDNLTVRCATGRVDAMGEIARKKPDGAVVNIRLPDGSGYELVEHLRGLPDGDGLAILVVGGPSAFVNRVDAIHCGADGYFDKPLNAEALMRRFQHLLERGRAEVPRVLAVEDDPDQAAFVKQVMEFAGYHTRVCADPAKLDAELTAFRPDLVLLDIQLPGTDGYKLARYIRQQEAHAALPILFLTTRSHLESQIESMRAGGDDYLIKPVAPGLLLSTVAARIERARFLRTLLERDGLTRLLTHTVFLERARALANARDSKQSLALVVIDLDDFKSMNDRYGHPAGDRVLCSLAALLRRHLRQSDLRGRLGGHEFAATIENIGEKQAVRLVERLRQEFAAIQQAPADGAPFRATFSAGIAMLEPGMDARSWRERADAALYAAKSKGRNRVASAAG